MNSTFQVYPIGQSPLSGLKNKRKLANLLGFESAKELQYLVDNIEMDYQFFELDGRAIQAPKKTSTLKRVQKRLSGYLSKIEAPEYLHSGIKGKSYRTNASFHADHLQQVPILVMDISKFFAKSRYHWVAKCFVEQFGCSGDIASILSRLLCINGHLPTGGAASTILSFYAYRPMFEKIKSLASSRGVKMSVYVDDMTFSGSNVDGKFKILIERVVASFGLKVNREKTKIFHQNSAKVITGLVITSRGLRIPNERRKVIFDELKAFRAMENKETPVGVKLKTRIVGLLTEAEATEPRFGVIKKNFLSSNL